MKEEENIKLKRDCDEMEKFYDLELNKIKDVAK
jgi:hypothetical protein